MGYFKNAWRYVIILANIPQMSIVSFHNNLIYTTLWKKKNQLIINLILFKKKMYNLIKKEYNILSL